MSAVQTTTRPITIESAELIHRVLLLAGIAAIGGMILYLAVTGYSYYSLPLEERPFSPLHSSLRSSGSVGLRLGVMSLGMFAMLFLYPLRKRWIWLSRIGNTRRWLNFHILLGITTPMVVTFHTAFKWHGLAGLAYWTMVAVALSGFVGRYVYSKIPRSLLSVKLTARELEEQMATLAGGLHEQKWFSSEALAPLLNIPGPDDIGRMNLIRILWTMLHLDCARPFLVRRLRLQVLAGSQRVTTLGGFLPSDNAALEAIVTTARWQSLLRVMMLFLERTERIFNLWHAVHRPFSVSFVVLIVIHIAVVLSVGF